MIGAFLISFRKFSISIFKAAWESSSIVFISCLNSLNTTSISSLVMPSGAGGPEGVRGSWEPAGPVVPLAPHSPGGLDWLSRRSL